MAKACTFPHCSCEYHCDGPGPACSYCGKETGIRLYHDGGGYIEPEYICGDCFTPRDDGPCFDDLAIGRGDFLQKVERETSSPHHPAVRAFAIILVIAGLVLLASLGAVLTSVWLFGVWLGVW